jgi:hypothetical protein
MDAKRMEKLQLELKKAQDAEKEALQKVKELVCSCIHVTSL